MEKDSKIFVAGHPGGMVRFYRRQCANCAVRGYVNIIITARTPGWTTTEPARTVEGILRRGTPGICVSCRRRQGAGGIVANSKGPGRTSCIPAYQHDAGDMT